MRLDIRYRMHFDYQEPVREAHNEIRVRPRDLPSQRLLAHRLTCVPVGRVLSFTDYFGTTVDHVGQLGAHAALEIIAESSVETRPVPAPGDGPVDGLDDDAFVLEHVEYLSESPHVQLAPEIVTVGRDIVRSHDQMHAAVQSVVDEVRRRLDYRSGSTHIGIALPDLLAGGAGVCQDFAHLAIGWLRGGGVPARYVSGYLFAADETNPEGDEHVVNVQTHAWVEAAIPGAGWLPVDPTNDRYVEERHVVIGFGRDYDDVAPVRGVYVGDAVPQVEASVEMRRMEPMDRVVSHQVRRRPQRVLASPPPVDVEQAQQQQQQQQ